MTSKISSILSKLNEYSESKGDILVSVSSSAYSGSSNDMKEAFKVDLAYCGFVEPKSISMMGSTSLTAIYRQGTNITVSSLALAKLLRPRTNKRDLSDHGVVTVELVIDPDAPPTELKRYN